MKSCCTVVCLGLLFSLGRHGWAEANGKTELEGTWVHVALEVDGKKLKVKEGSKLTVTGNKAVLKAGDTVVFASTFKLDPSKKPKASDTTYTAGPKKGKTYKGIYQLDGDTLKFCVPGSPEDERPTEFVSKEGTGGLVSVYKREKP